MSPELLAPRPRGHAAPRAAPPAPWEETPAATPLAAADALVSAPRPDLLKGEGGVRWSMGRPTCAGARERAAADCAGWPSPRRRARRARRRRSEGPRSTPRAMRQAPWRSRPACRAWGASRRARRGRCSSASRRPARPAVPGSTRGRSGAPAPSRPGALRGSSGVPLRGEKPRLRRRCDTPMVCVASLVVMMRGRATTDQPREPARR